jgi:spore coat protein U-like protein
MRRLALSAAIAVLSLLPSEASAQSCTSAEFTGSFGPTVIDIVPDSTATATATFRADCTTASNGIVTYCLYVDPVGNQIRNNTSYHVTGTADSRLAWRIRGGIAAVDIPRAGSGLATSGQSCGGGANAHCVNNAGYTLTYLPRQQQDRVRPGTYTNSFNITALIGARPNGSSTATYCATPPAGTQVINSTVTVTANVLEKCQFENLKDIDFGSVGSVTAARSAPAAIRAEGNIGVRCTYGTPYSITIGDGLHAQGGVRRMQSGSHFLSYQLFQPDCSTAWSLTSALAGTGTTVNALNNHKVCALLTTPLAAAPAAGTYEDTVVITATF